MSYNKQDTKRRMDGALDVLHKEFSGLRTGRARSRSKFTARVCL